MPLAKGKSKKSVETRFHEFRHGKTYARTKRKYGKTVARKQLIAVSLGDRGGKKKAKRKAGVKRKVKAKGKTQITKRKTAKH